MNWRIIVGLSLLLLGIKVVYTAISSGAVVDGSSIIGSIIWVIVGLYLLIKGMTKNEQQL